MTSRRPARAPVLPYFDVLLPLLHQKSSAANRAFGQHVHWGYWAEPADARPTVEDFVRAAGALTVEMGRAADLRDGQRVIDIGCGVGGTLASLDTHYRAMQWVGLNIDHRQLVYAAEETAPAHEVSASWVQGDACRLPFAADRFDAALAVECIFHFPDRRAFFDEAHRILKPGGRLAFSDFVPVTPLGPLLRLLALRPTKSTFYGRCDFSYTRRAYRELAEATGFRIVLDRDITGNTLPTYPFLRSLRAQIPSLPLSAKLETAFAELASRSGGLRYRIVTLQKTA